MERRITFYNKFLSLLESENMRLVQRGIANNFGLVGKNLRKYLATTALTATGLMISAAPALADNWTDHVASEGSISIDTSVPNTTNIKQHTDFTKVSGDGDINAGWTVNVAQPSNNSKYVLYDIENDPTMIMGNLNANGKVYIFDQNGVVFGGDSQVNVGSIVVSTGHVSDANIKADKLVFEDVGTDGEIVNNGEITVAEAGLVAMVAPSVKNNGKITAHMGTVVLASAEKVAIDMYGDQLVSVALEGALEQAMIENKGSIEASGGLVTLDVAAAKNAVDNVINMDGIIDVSSVSVKGGKIILNGGDKGVVKVAGKLKADGKDGGSVKITGQNIHLTETSEISADAVAVGNGGRVDVVAQNGLVFGGNISAKGGALGGNGGFVDTSGLGWVDIYGNVDASAINGTNGTWLIDPTNLTITNVGSTNVGGTGSSGSPFAPDGDTISILRTNVIEAALNAGTDVYVTTVGSPNKVLQDGTITILASITKNAGIASTLFLDAAGSIIVSSGKDITATAGTVLNVVFEAAKSIFVNDSEITTGSGDVTFTAGDGIEIGALTQINTAGGDASMTAEKGSFFIGNGSAINTAGGDITVRADGTVVTLGGVPVTGVVNVNGVLNAGGGDIDIHQSAIFDGDADSLRTSGTGTVSVNQNKVGTKGKIQNAIDAIQNTGTGLNTVSVGAGTFYESLALAENNFLIKGANYNINPNTGVRGAETIIDPNSPGAHVTADNVEINGVLITGATGVDGYGIWFEGASNGKASNNIIRDTEQDGIKTQDGDTFTITNNEIDDTRGNGILVDKSGGTIDVSGNFIGTNATSAAIDGIWGDGIEIAGVNNNTTVSGNTISNTWDPTKDNTNDDSSGIYLRNSRGIVVNNNTVTDTDWDGIKVANGANNIVQDNNVSGSTRIGIYAENTDNLSILGNTVHDADLLDSGVITVVGGSSHDIIGNTVTNILGTSTTDAGIKVHYIKGTDNNITDNTIYNIDGDGIRGTEIVDGATINENNISLVKGDGIQVTNSTGILHILSNFIGKELEIGGIEGNGIYLSGVNNSFVRDNDIWNTKASNPADGDDASGIYLDNIRNMTVTGNYIRGADWDGIKLKNGGDHIIQNNDIAHTTRIGIYGENTENSFIFGNKVHDSNLADSGGITIVGGSSHEIIANTVNDVIGVSGTNAGIKVHYIKGTDNFIDDNTVYNINGDGIRGTEIVDGASISRNIISLTKGDGIRMTMSTGILNIDSNLIGKEAEVGGIEGNGVYLTGVNNSFVTNNTIWNTKASNPADGDDASGVYLDNIQNMMVSDNTITGADWDGVKIKNGANNIVQDNDIAHTTRIGIYGENTNNLSVLRNTVYDSNLADSGGITVIGGSNHDIIGNTVHNAPTSGTDAGIKVHYIQGAENYIKDNIIYDINGDGIRGTEIVEYAEISGNDIDDVAGDGIDINDFGHLLIENNDVRDAGDNGMLIQNGDSVSIMNNVGLGGTANGVSVVGKNGIKVGHVEYVNIINNEIDLAGWDGIHVEYFHDANILGNRVSRSGDDGIEAHDGHWVNIDGNNISQSGYGVIDEEEGGEDYGGFDEFNSGGDGIHVRNIYSKYLEGESEGEYGIYLFGGYEDGSVRITNNIINVSKDDGVDVERVEGYVYIAGNTISDSGVTNDGATVIYSTPDYYGADGIHVKDVVLGYGDFSGDIREGDAGNGEYNIVVYDNDIAQSLDDGVEILGNNYDIRAVRVSALVEDGDYWEEIGEDDYEEEYDYWYGNTGRVLVQENVISNSGWGNPYAGFGQSYNYYSGGDGIHVEGIYAYGYSAGSSPEGEFSGYAVDILGNTVDKSGDDGIDVEYSSSTLIDNNTVTNSGWVGEGGEGGEMGLLIAESGTGADWYGADGIFVNNVGERYSYGYDKISPLAEGIEGPGDDYEEYSVVIRRNSVDNSLDDGIQVNNTMSGYGGISKASIGIYDYYGYTAPVLVGGNNPGDGNTVTDSGSNGLYISGPGHNNVIVSGNAFARFDTGAKFESGLIDLTGAGNTFANGRIGLRFSPYGYSEGGEIPYFDILDFYGTYLDLVDNDGAGSTPYPTTPTNFGGTIGSQTFTGFTETGDFYVYLDNGAFTNDATPVWINGLNSSYDGIKPSTTGGALTQEQYDFLEARFRHFPDAGASSTDIFWFGFVDENPLIDQSLIFNRFGVFNGDATGLNVRIVSLPFVPGGSNPTPSALNSLSTFAGNNTQTDPTNLNQIETAAGGDGSPTVPQNLNNIEAAAGDDNENCWGNAVAAASGGQVVSVVYTGGFAANLNQAAACGTGF